MKQGYLDPELIKQVAIAAESCGFYAFLSWDHYMLPDAPDTLDAWSILGSLSGITSRIKLGTVVTPIPFRPPAQLAKIVSSLDHLSGGRSILGVGAGWHQPEFDAFSEWATAAERVSRTEEALGLITELWSGKPTTFKGNYYNTTNATISPKPTQVPRPPLWFGVRGRRMLKLAARYGQVWIPTNISPSEYASGLKNLHEMQDQWVKTDKIKGALQNFSTFSDSSECLETILQYKEAGCEYYGSVWSYPPQEMVSRINWFANNVISKLD